MSKNSKNETRTLPDVFKELQDARYSSLKKQNVQSNCIKITRIDISKFIIFLFFMGIFLFITSSSKKILAMSENKNNSEELSPIIFESNENVIDLQDILVKNVQVDKIKKIEEEERDIPFKTTIIENSQLPRDEKVVEVPGMVGKEKVKFVRTYENGQVVDEKILESTILSDGITEVIKSGTSDYLLKHHIHIGDILYATTILSLKQSPNPDSPEICTIDKYYDVLLTEVSEEWCKVSFNMQEGYVQSNLLVSVHTDPEIAKKNRISKALSKLNFNMELNKPSGFSLEDFQEMLSGNIEDKNMVFIQNAKYFYEAEQKYNINGVFLAAVGIHESGWGTSAISIDKNNLFGYGSYDSDAYNSSFAFNGYVDGINTVAKVFAKNYVNIPGTTIGDNEIASGKYYNGPTLSGINKRYASDTNWANAVYSHMEYLYGKLKID